MQIFADFQSFGLLARQNKQTEDTTLDIFSHFFKHATLKTEDFKYKTYTELKYDASTDFKVTSGTSRNVVDSKELLLFS